MSTQIKSVWQFNAENAHKVKHAAPFPIELPQRFIQLFRYKNDLMFNSFIDSGTTAIATLSAMRSKRNTSKVTHD